MWGRKSPAVRSHLCSGLRLLSKATLVKGKAMSAEIGLLTTTRTGAEVQICKKVEG